ncbi:MAG: hypothetical protein ACYDD1_16535 [Caulobacteraceae bacterium]
MRRLLAPILILSLALAATSAHAAEDKKKGAEGLDVNMSTVAVPVLFHGRVVNYIFVSLRLMLKPGSDPVKLREKEPYFRDALVRLASRTALNKPDDLSKINEGLLKADMLAECAKIVGPGLVSSVVIVKEAAQHEAWDLPKPDPLGQKPAKP